MLRSQKYNHLICDQHKYDPQWPLMIFNIFPMSVSNSGIKNEIIIKVLRLPSKCFLYILRLLQDVAWSPDKIYLFVITSIRPSSFLPLLLQTGHESPVSEGTFLIIVDTARLCQLEEDRLTQ